MLLLLKLLLPYFTVGIFWCVFKNAWIALLSYHAFILCFARGAKVRFALTFPKPFWGLIAPSILAGPLLFFILPWIGVESLRDWLTDYSVTTSHLLLIPYFGLIHPTIEQMHWAPLCQKTPLAHLCFAGYHIMVLASLLSPLWLGVSFLTLASISVFWHILRIKSQSISPAALSHTLADLSIVSLLLVS